MSSKSILLYIAIVVLSLFANISFCSYNQIITTVKPSCGKNEAYSKCGNNGCQNTCKDPTFAERCKGPCIPGCVCKEGFLLNDKGKCVSKSECSSVCKENEILNRCPQYCTFDKTCEELLFGYIRDCPRPPPFYKCKPTCFCKPGYVRIDGVCRPSSDCCTEQNTEMVSCPNPCPGGTCMTPKFLSCDQQCEPWGCQCKEGYVKNKEGKCIKLSECNESCGKNEKWVDCIPYCFHERTCGSLFIHLMPPYCPPPPSFWQCKGRCMCVSGFIRIDGICQPENNCCSKPNTVLFKCHRWCNGGTCDMPFLGDCNEACWMHSCECQEGFVKRSHDNDTCVPLNECEPLFECGINEKYNHCPSKYNPEPNCVDKLDHPIRPTVAMEQCSGMPKCECVEPYARHQNGECVHRDKC